MRQALFAVVLVAASFAGGAAVNGPGLRWAQAWAMGRLGLVHDGDTYPTPAPTADPDTSDGTIPPLAIPPTRDETGTARSTLAPTDAKAAAGQADAPATARAKAAGPWAPEPSVDGADRSVASPPASAPAPPAALAPAEMPTLARPEALAAPGDVEPPAPVRLASAAEKSGPAPASTPARGGADGNVSHASLPGRDMTPSSDPADWQEVRRALKVRGVSRYGTDGEPGGRVRFHCLIPLAGRRAVGQHFEAEGDDEFQAARAALRRVALWRATEGQTP